MVGFLLSVIRKKKQNELNLDTKKFGEWMNIKGKTAIVKETLIQYRAPSSNLHGGFTYSNSFEKQKVAKAWIYI